MADWGNRFEMSEPIRLYSLENSTSLPVSMRGLIAATMQQPYCRMMGRPEVLSLNMMLMRTMRATRVLDIGVYTGLSSLAAALSIPEHGRVVACDVSDQFIPVGRPFWRQAGVEQKIEVRIQPAVKSLKDLLATPGNEGTFDFAFIDADKNSYDIYYELTLRLLRPGGMIALDNVLWSGSVLEGAKDISRVDPATAALVQLNHKASRDPRVLANLVNIGDGLMLIHKL